MVTTFFVVEIPDNLQITAHHFSDLVKVPRGFFCFFSSVHLYYFGGEPFPIGSVYGIFTYIYHRYQPNVGKYNIHGYYGFENTKRLLVVLR